MFPGEGISDGSVSVVKTHHPCEGCWTIPKTGKPVRENQSGDLKGVKFVVYVMRSPFDAMVAEYNRKFTGLNHTGVLPKSAFETDTWNDFVRDRTRIWKRTVIFIYAGQRQFLAWKWKSCQTGFLLYSG